jgi:hypothetical protein
MRVKVAALIVAALIVRLKVAVMVVFTATPEVAAAGVMEVTAGALGGGIVPDPEPDPPHPETARAADARRNTYPKRILKTLIELHRTYRSLPGRFPARANSKSIYPIKTMQGGPDEFFILDNL